MTAQLVELIRSRCKPLLPKQTQLQPKQERLNGVRAVLFDVYGTLMISASGDIGSNTGDHRHTAVSDVAELFGVQLSCESAIVIDRLQQQIQDDHAAARSSGIPYPEIEIRDVWRKVISDVIAPSSPMDAATIDFANFALQYELRVNPTWPMPGAHSTLEGLANLGMVLGIVSNAQFFTPLLFPALLDRDLEQWGFASNLTYLSYEHQRAKPGTDLYQMAKRDLAKAGISAEEVLYVGNDMLNDVTAAQQVGFRTALFAGDQRSLRLRSDDKRVHGVEADLIVTELTQLLECL